MFDELFQIPDIYLFVLLSCVSISISIVFICLVKWLIPLHLRYQDNAVIGNTASLISIIYGVLAGLSALYLINNNSYASDAVQREANAVANVYRYSQWLQDPARSKIQSEIQTYIQKVIDVEWPLMEQGKKIDGDGDAIIEEMTDQLIHYSAVAGSEVLALHEMLTETKDLYNARQQRIHMSYSELSPELWMVILIGTILTLFINFLFGVNFYLHILTVVAVAIMTSSMIFLLVALDRPFQGEFVIEPIAFKDLLSHMRFVEKPSSNNDIAVK